MVKGGAPRGGAPRGPETPPPDRRELLKAKWTARLTAEKGAQWVADNKKLLEWQWEYLTECNFI